MTRDGYTGVMTTTFAPVPARNFTALEDTAAEAVKMVGSVGTFPHFESHPGYARGAWVGTANYGI